jgi:hypothetical protein
MLFDEVFRPGDSKDAFLNKVDSLAVDFRREHATGPVHQLGLAVPDAEAAASELEASGAGPFFIAEGETATWREQGAERRYRGKLGIGYLHGLELELLEAGEGSDLYSRFMDPGGRPVLHHLAFVVQDVDFWRRKMEKSDCPVMVDGIIRAGPMKIDFAYFDTLGKAGIILEFESYRLLNMIERRPPRFVYHAIGRFQKLSGIRSFRV